MLKEFKTSHKADNPFENYLLFFVLLHNIKFKTIIKMKKVLVIFLVLFAFIKANAQTFVLSEIIPPPSHTPTQEELNTFKNLIGKYEMTLTFTDKDVRISGKGLDGDYHSEILQNMGNNIYRKYDNKDNYGEIEVSKYLGVISSFTMTNIKHGKIKLKLKFKRKVFK